MAGFEQHPRFRKNGPDNQPSHENQPKFPEISGLKLGADLLIPIRYAATDGASATGGLIPGSVVHDSEFLAPIPKLGPTTVLFQIEGRYVFAGWDDQQKWAVHTDGPLIIGQTPLGEAVKFLLPEGYEKLEWVKMPDDYDRS